MDRKKLIERVKALLAKTTENGCTEFEALSALTKAQALMSAHSIADADLTFGGEGVEKRAHSYAKANIIPNILAQAVADFCACRVWNNPGRGSDKPEITFLGLESDVVLATWLLGTLEEYVKRSLRHHMAGMTFYSSRQKTITRNGFIIGCCTRISNRLAELSRDAREASPVVDGRALVVVKGALVDAAFVKLGLNMRAPRNSLRMVSDHALSAGRAAGDNATFGRPVSGSAPAMIGRG